VLAPRACEVPLDGASGLIATATVIPGAETKRRKGGRRGIESDAVAAWHSRRARGIDPLPSRAAESMKIEKELGGPPPKWQSIRKLPAIKRLHDAWLKGLCRKPV
jgi:hypothetical protein